VTLNLERFAELATREQFSLAEACLLIAEDQYPGLDIAACVAKLDAMAATVRGRLAADAAAEQKVAALNRHLFGELGFCGNADAYYDPRNSYLNEVLDRRTGIPITLALVYMEVARRAGVTVEGINFPGHFLVRCPMRRGQYDDLIIDAFHGGALLSEDGCLQLLRRHAGEGAVWDDAHLRARATKPQILARMLVNLKRVYVQMHSFPQARDITELLLAVDPSATHELRDRGLLAYQLNDFAAALRDLQEYLRLSAKGNLDEDERSEQAQIWEHVKTLRRRVASLN
jgi:regulator of sirC expression with transglutaminase-like and TPR domain